MEFDGSRRVADLDDPRIRTLRVHLEIFVRKPYDCRLIFGPSPQRATASAYVGALITSRGNVGKTRLAKGERALRAAWCASRPGDDGRPGRDVHPDDVRVGCSDQHVCKRGVVSHTCPVAIERDRHPTT